MVNFAKSGYEYKFVFKAGALENIKKVMGWETEVEMANALGYTKQRINQIGKPGARIDDKIIAALAQNICRLNPKTMALEGKWWVHFDIVAYAPKDPNNSRHNYSKMYGHVPYMPFSPNYELRRRDFESDENSVDKKNMLDKIICLG